MKSVTPSAAPKRAVPARPHAYGLMSSSAEDGKILRPSKNPLLAGVFRGLVFCLTVGSVTFFPLLSGKEEGAVVLLIRGDGAALCDTLCCKVLKTVCVVGRFFPSGSTLMTLPNLIEIGRASCRERVCQYV